MENLPRWHYHRYRSSDLGGRSSDGVVTRETAGWAKGLYEAGLMNDLVRAFLENEQQLRLIKRLGRGGFAEVWEVEAPSGVRSAVKVSHRSPGRKKSGGAEGAGEPEADSGPGWASPPGDTDRLLGGGGSPGDPLGAGHGRGFASAL
jgi:hypothetical protein